MPVILDTYSEFLSYWEKYKNLPVKEQIEGWAFEYMGMWPDLLKLQQKDYSDISEDWREIALDRVFPFLHSRLNSMQEAHGNLIGLIEPLHNLAMEKFSVNEFDVLYVIYVGIGCGAGWVTRVRNSQAILFGLEMIAECGWTESDSLKGLIAHEIGHAIHGKLRQDPELNQENGPWWQLYTEGYAQRCEHIIMGRNSWRELTVLNTSDWLEWCTENKSMLAGKFLQMVEEETDVRPFFGSWFDIQGYKQCGYYLGHEVISDLEQECDIRKLAVLKDVRLTMKSVLESYISNG
ncbi:MAG: hypothetical protein K8R76_09865 [Candidatus Aegiribacteria sp.]|nr:hypothetical protein [Candidatus Aegiribacteria sp.]